VGWRGITIIILIITILRLHIAYFTPGLNRGPQTIQAACTCRSSTAFPSSSIHNRGWVIYTSSVTRSFLRSAFPHVHLRIYLFIYSKYIQSIFDYRTPTHHPTASITPSPHHRPRHQVLNELVPRGGMTFCLLYLMRTPPAPPPPQQAAAPGYSHYTAMDEDDDKDR
jgi:hypothetical protein